LRLLQGFVNLFKNKSIRLLALKEPGTSSKASDGAYPVIRSNAALTKTILGPGSLIGIRLGNEDDIVEVRDTSI
jgi:hypothetical protein